MELIALNQNGTEIRLFAMRRSGSHAVADWLTTLFPGAVCFLNDVTRFQPIDHNQEGFDLPSLSSGRKVSLHENKDLLLYNFEDVNLATYGRHWLPSNLKGSTLKRFTVLLLRDPFNLFASRLKLRRTLTSNSFAYNLFPPGEKSRRTLQDMWIEHADEYLGRTHYLGETVVRISYNDWLLRPEYRQELADSLGGTLCKSDTDRIPKYGFGSSFEGYRHGKLRNRIGLLHRWRHFRNDLEFESIVSSKPLQELSNQIFGNIVS